jgi:hypothetical protein
MEIVPQKTVLGAMLLFCVFCAGQTDRPSSPPALSSNELVLAAETTYRNYSRGCAERRTDDGGIEIPSRCWAEPIKALKPIRVYTHRVNIVVVQRFQNNVEEGKYIYIPISSYLPQSGDDGFEFTPNPLQGGIYHVHEVFDFKRTRTR